MSMYMDWLRDVRSMLSRFSGRKTKPLGKRTHLRPIHLKWSAMEALENRRMLTVGPDGYGYSANAHTYENLNLAPAGPGVVSVLDDADDSTAAVDLGTDTFRFYGVEYTGSSSLYVSDNGLITFGSANTSPSNSSLASTPTQRAIAPLWDDWVTNLDENDQVLAKFRDLNGDGTNDQLIVEWNDVTHSQGGGSVTFQAILTLNTDSRDGDVFFNYPDLATGEFISNGGSATVGIKDVNPTGDNVLLISQNNSANALLGDEQAIRVATTAVDADVPTVAITAVSPDPRNSTVNTISIVFDAEVIGFDLSDLSLTLDGGDNLLTEAQTLTTGDNITFTLGNLAGLTGEEGTYLLTLTANGSHVADYQYNLLATGDTETWEMDTTAPTADIVNISPDPRKVAVGVVTINFTEDVTGFGLSDLALTLDGNPVDISGLTLTTVNAHQYTINLTTVTGDEGVYLLTLAAGGSGITDSASNAFAVNATDGWTMDTTAPNAPSTPNLDFASDTGDFSNDGLTNDTTPTFSGTAEANSTVELFADGDSLGTTTADGDGDWSFTVSTPLTNGTYSITAKATDAAGNESVASGGQSIEIDTTAPDAPSTPNMVAGSDSGDSDTDNITDDTTPTINGTAEANSTVEIFIDGESDGTATADGNGDWSYTFGALSNGTYEITAKAMDAAGNESSTSSALEVTIDTVAPSAPSTPDLASDSDTGASSTDNLTKDTTPTFTGTAEANSLVEIFIDGNSDGTTAADEDGNWSYTAGALGTGTYAVTAKATDSAGNQSVASAGLSIEIDADAPTANIVDVSPDPRTKSVSSITITFSEAVAGFDLADLSLTLNAGSNLLTGSQTLTTSNNITYVLGNLAGITNSTGTYLLTLTAAESGIGDIVTNDLAGDATDTWVTDVTRPTADIVNISPDPRNSVVGVVTINFSENVTGFNLADLSLTRGGNPVDISGLTLTTVDPDQYTIDLTSVTGTDGTYVLTLTAAGSGIEDSATWAMIANATDSWVIDTVDPSAPSTPDLVVGDDSGSSATDNVTSEILPTFTGTAEANSTVELFADAISLGTTTADGDGEWSFTVPADVPDGTYTVTAKATDAAGNESVASGGLSVTVDTADPAAPSTPNLESASDSGDSNTDNLTNDTTPTVSGTAEANSTIEIFVDGDSDGTTTADGNGDWSYTINALDEGTYSITAKATDAAGNVSDASAALSITIDTTAPTANIVDISPDPRNTAVGVVTVNFDEDVTGVNIADFSLTLDGNPVDISGLSVTEVNPQQYTIDLTTVTAADGVYVLTLTAAGSNIEDIAGNALAVNASDTWEEDVTAPAAPSTPDLASGSDLGTSNTDDLTSDTTPTFTGTAEADSTVEVFADGNSLGTTTADENGDWSFTASAMAGGTYDITAKATDAAGNEGVASAALTIVVDASAPAAPSTPDLVSGSDSGSSNTDNITDDTTPTFTGTAVANSTVEVFANGVSKGTTTSDGNGDWSFTSPALTAGTYSITAKTLDDAGNASAASGALSVTIDTGTPAAPSTPDLAVGSDTGSSSTDNVTNDTTPTFNGTAEAGSTVEVFRNGVSLGTTTADGEGNWSLTAAAQSAGTYSITATATDAAGHTSDASAGLSITIDVTAPSAPSTPDLAAGSDSGSSNTDNLTNDTTPTFNGTAEANSTVEVFRNGVSIGTTTADGGGSWSLTAGTQSAGTYTITAKATDAAGNESSASSGLSITIDTTAPSTPAAPDMAAGSDSGSSNTDNITNDTTPTFNGTAEANSTVAISINGEEVDTVTADGDGDWTYTASTLEEGEYEVSVTATDAAGNVSEDSAELSIEVDTTAPTADVVNVTPDPRSSSVESVEIEFDEAVVGVNLADLSLKLNAGANLLAEGHTVTTEDNVTWTLGDITAVTSANGSYVAALTASGSSITDLAGNALAVDANDGWTMSNTAPTLTLVNNLTNGFRNTPYTITYAALAAAANEADVNGDAEIVFRVQSVTTGTLTKDGEPIVAGTTTLGPEEELVWTPAANATGTLNAFKIRAFDGLTASATDLQVKVVVGFDVVNITVVDDEGTEGLGEPDTVTYRITRTQTSGAMTVTFARSGTAALTTDYTLTTPGGNGSTTVVIPDGEESVDITLTPVDNAVPEVTETAKLTLVDTTAYNLGVDKVATATITDDEAVVRIEALTEEVIEGTATAKFRIHRSMADEDNTNPLVVKFSRSGTATFSATDATKDYALSTGTLSSVTIPANEDSVDITVTARNDSIAEVTKTIKLTLVADATKYTLDPDLADRSATMSLIDNEPVVKITALNSPALEGTNTAKFRISRELYDGSPLTTGALVVKFARSGNATYTSDFTFNTGNVSQVTIPDGESFVDITVTINNDVIADINETIKLTLATNGTLYNIKTGSSNATVTITNVAP